MKPLKIAMALICAAVPFCVSYAQDDTRTIRLIQDDAQVRFTSKLYELKNVKATDIYPYISTAVLRYHQNSKVQTVKFSDAPDAPLGLLVSTGEAFIPYVDELIKKLDIPAKKDDSGSIIEGTGVTRVAYTPKYRAAIQFENLITSLIASSEGRVYVNYDNNTIFWQDSDSSAKAILEWVKQLDRPLPQVNIRVNYYEVRDSTLRDIGFDYLAWKNGPGVNFLNVGYNAGRLVVDELFKAVATNLPAAVNFAESWGYGGFMFAPQFNMSFIRMLQQSGNANLAAEGNITMVNTPVSSLEQLYKLREFQNANPDRAPFRYKVTMQPEYQNIAKTAEGRSYIGASHETDGETGKLKKDPPDLTVVITNPLICFPQKAGDANAQGFIPSDPAFYLNNPETGKNGGVIFKYDCIVKNVVERGGTGAELSNSSHLTGAMTLGFGVEKVVNVYEQENEVTQTIGLPVLCKIPILKYLFSTTTTMTERTYIVMTVQAGLVHPEGNFPDGKSRTKDIAERDVWK